MYKICFYKDKNGNIPVLEYLEFLATRKDKDSRIKYQKLNDYITVLETRGIAAGMPYIRHLDGPIYELRPIRDRVLFVSYYEGQYILLHQFVKKTQKTPKKEIEKAYREFKEIKESGELYE